MLVKKVNKYFKQIKKAAIDGKLIFFVGAGVSSLSGYPNWKGLVHEFEKGLEGENTEVRNYASDEYLRIPQKFYVSKTKHEYDAILDKFFNVEYDCNDIHDMMVELSPAHFITTNYDRLIEKACLKKYKNYSSISCDQGVAKASSSNYILKVHGEFGDIVDGKDVVLKEDDYIEYDANYPLINNLAKSLVATNTVVFIGYSLNDYNINQMLNWVKRIQKNDFSHYFVRDKHNPLKSAEIKYYEKKGMNIIDVTTLVDSEEDDYHKRYRYFMEKLVSESKWDKIKDLKSSVKYIEEKLSQLNQFNYIRKVDLKHLFDDDYSFFPSGRIRKNEKCKYDYFNEYFIYKARKNKRKDIDIIIESIDRRLLKLGINRILDWETKDEDIRVIMEQHPEFSATNLLFENRYDDMEVVLKQQVANVEEQLQQAFYTAGLGEWEKAYDSYTEIIRIAYLEKNWIVYFIAQLNRYFLSRLISVINKQLTSYYSVIVLKRTYNMFSDEFLQKVEKDTTYQIPRLIFEGMPNAFKIEYSFLKWLCDEVSFSNETSELSKLQFACSKKILSNSIYTAVDNDFNRLNLRLNDDVRFLFENFIWVYPSFEFKGMVQMSLNPLFESIKKGQANNNLVSFFGDEVQIKGDEYYFDYYDFIYMVKCFNLKDLKQIFKDIDIRKVRIEGLERIKGFVVRTLKRFEKESKHGNEGIQVIRYILTNEEIKNILYICCNFTFALNDLEYLVDFTLNIAYERDLNIGDRCYYVLKLLMNNEYNEKVINIIDEFLWTKYDLRSNEGYRELTNRSGVYQGLAKTIKLKKGDYYHERLSNALIDKKECFHTKEQLNFLFVNIEILSPAAQLELIKIKKEYSLESLVELLDLGILKNLVDYREKIINATEKVIEKINENKRLKQHTFPEPTIRYTGILCYFGYIEKEKVDIYLGICNEFDMFVEPESFNFEENMDLEWLRYYTPKVLQGIFSNILMKQKIQQILKKSLLEKPDNALMKLYLEYCLD